MASILARTSRAGLSLSLFPRTLLRTRTLTSSVTAASRISSTSLLLRPRNSILFGNAPRVQFASTAARLKTSPAQVAEDFVGEEDAEDLATEFVEEEAAEPLPEFSTLAGSIHPGTHQALTKKPFNLKTMSPVQAAVLPMTPTLSEPYSPDSKSTKRDLFVKARTGTGKTISFLVPSLEARLKAIQTHTSQALIDANKVGDKRMEEQVKRAFVHSEVGTLILSPTRELATQIATEAQKLTAHHDGGSMGVHLLVGGMSRGYQLRSFLKGRKDFVVATTGRLRDLMEEPEVREAISKTRTLVLDEADTLLDMGFRPDIDAISKQLPAKGPRQTFMFSATVPPAIKEICRELLSPKHEFIDCVPKDTPAVDADISMYHTVLPTPAEQIPYVMQLLAHDQLVHAGESKTVVFCNTTSMTRLLATMVRELAGGMLPAGRKTAVYEIHSKKDQQARFNTSARFRADKSGSSILITSDVSARGVDYPGVTRVIQVGIPASATQYTHRVGRTGRAGRKGRSDLVLQPFESSFIETSLGNFLVPHLSTTELQSELTQLSSSFDADPTAFWDQAMAQVTPPKESAPVKSNPRDRQRKPSGPTMYRAPITPTLQVIPDTYKSFLPELDTQAVDEAFSSSLGYYIGRVGDLTCSRNAMLDGLRQWTLQACGLSVPPYVSDNFLRKIGFSSGSGRNSRNSPGDRGRERKPHWASPRSRDTYGLGGDGYRDRDGSRGAWRNRDYAQDATKDSAWGSRRRTDGGASSYEGGEGERSFGSSFGGRDSRPRRPSYGSERPSYSSERPSYSSGRFGGGEEGSASTEGFQTRSRAARWAAANGRDGRSARRA